MIGPNNREARQWDQVRQQAVLRKLEQARMEAVKSILEGKPLPQPVKAERRWVQADMLTERAA